MANKKFGFLVHKRTRTTTVARLARALFCPQILNSVDTLVAPEYTLYNWGCANIKVQHPINKILNKNLENVVDKILFASCCSYLGIPHPKYTTSLWEATRWSRDGVIVVVRELVRSRAGRGITIVKPGEEMPEGKLYTVYFPKTKEFRVHIFEGEIIDFQQKMRKRGDEPNRFVRTHDNGWIYARKNIPDYPEVGELAVEAMNCLGLSYGAVDVMAKTRRGELIECMIGEINSAPGLTGTTEERWVNAFLARQV